MPKLRSAISDIFDIYMGNPEAPLQIILILGFGTMVALLMLTKTARASGSERYGVHYAIPILGLAFAAALVMPAVAKLFVVPMLPKGPIADWAPVWVTAVFFLAIVIPIAALLFGINYIQSMATIFLTAVAVVATGFVVRIVFNATGRVGGNMKKNKRERQHDVNSF